MSSSKGKVSFAWRCTSSRTKPSSSMKPVLEGTESSDRRNGVHCRDCTFVRRTCRGTRISSTRTSSETIAWTQRATYSTASVMCWAVMAQLVCTFRIDIGHGFMERSRVWRTASTEQLRAV